jgi:membrane protein implicated in regulation of membrane protease activity
MNLELYQITLVISLLLVVAEIMTGTFFLLGLAVGVGALVPIHLFTGEISWGRDLIVVATFSAFAFILLRRIFKKPADSELITSDVNKY